MTTTPTTEEASVAETREAPPSGITDIPLTARHDLERICDRTGIEVRTLAVVHHGNCTTITLRHDELTALADGMTDPANQDHEDCHDDCADEHELEEARRALRDGSEAIDGLLEEADLDDDTAKALTKIANNLEAAA